MKTALYKLDVGASSIPVRFVRARNARRYILRLLPDNIARVTIPHGGSLEYAREFLRRNSSWLEKQLRQAVTDWQHGTQVLIHGTPHTLRILADPSTPLAFLGGSSIVLRPGQPIRPQIEQHLATLAAAELVPLTLTRAREHQLEVLRVRIGNQRTRWGSCSTSKTISLNWRLIQAPPHVREYIIIHELMHLREMNHSPRFWAHVAHACPNYLQAESWLRKNSHLLR